MTGPLYERAVELLGKYRQLAARIPKAKANTAGKLDRTLERLGEGISELLEELTDYERMALFGWTNGILPNSYEVDHAELMATPYENIRLSRRWTEEVDVGEDYEVKEESDEVQAQRHEELLRFLKLPTDGLDTF